MKYSIWYSTLDSDLTVLLPKLCERVVKALPREPSRPQGGQPIEGMPWQAAAVGSEHFSVREWIRLRGKASMLIRCSPSDNCQVAFLVDISWTRGHCTSRRHVLFGLLMTFCKTTKELPSSASLKPCLLFVTLLFVA